MNGTTHLLIVEDDATLLRGLKDTFVRDGFTVTIASDGHRAVEAALDGNREPDLVLLDLMLPGLDGLAVCRRLRKEAFANAILILTARGQEGDVVRGLEAGADDYLAKPFSLAKLRARIQALLRRQRRGHVPVLSFGECTWDASACSLTRQGQPVPLTPQERELLSYLTAHLGLAVSRDTLLRAISKRSLLTTTRTIDQAIKNLRLRIEPQPSKPVHLLTVREVGYKFMM